MAQVTEILSCNRMIKKAHKLDHGGNLMMAALPHGDLQISITFTGSHRNERTDFKVDQSLQYMANTFSIELDGNLYYLCAEGDKVFLQKLVAKQPNDKKYMFEVKYVNDSSNYMSIKSIKTGKYLASDEDGKAFMEEVNPSSLVDGQPIDRQTWFYLHRMETVKRERESTLHSCYCDGASLDYSVLYQNQVEAC